jgi:hypothetical protein
LERLAGVEPVKRFKSQQLRREPHLGAYPESGCGRQARGGARETEGGQEGQGGAQSAKGAPVKSKATKKTTAAKNAPKAKTAAKTPEAPAPREGSKTAQVVAMLQWKNGATLTEIMDKMGWQRHTVRGFMAGAMKKAGYAVESFKPEGGERTYRINL